MNIYKYRLDYYRPTRVPGRILSTGLDPNDDLCVWSAVGSGEQPHHDVTAMMTGPHADIEDTDQFVGSVRDGSIMTHVFARPVA